MQLTEALNLAYMVIEISQHFPFSSATYAEFLGWRERRRPWKASTVIRDRTDQEKRDTAKVL